jgi:hypothetical protein
MAQLINEAKRFQQLAGILIESQLDEVVDTLRIQEHTSEEGNKQVTLSVLGGGFEENQVTLSSEEAKVLVELAKEFVQNRNNSIGKAVNTSDENMTQSTIGIKPEGLSLNITRKEGSVYKGYDIPVEGNAGYLKAQQSIIYQIIDELGKHLNEVAPTTSTTSNTPTDVKNLNKAQTAATTVQNRAKTINNIQEFPGAFENWFKTLGFQPGKISKSAIRTQVEKVLTNLGYK